jgi:hypothetical protein
MQPRQVLILVIVASLLGGLWIAISHQAPPRVPAPVTSPLSTIDALSIKEFSIVQPDGSPSPRILWDTRTDMWLGLIADRQSFPLVSSRIRGYLRLLDAALKQPIQSEQEVQSFRGVVVHLRDAQGATHTLRLSQTSLAGERLMLEENPAKPGFGWVRRVEATFASVSEQFQNTLDTTIVPWEPGATPLDTIRMHSSESGEAPIELARRAGVWVMTSPISARANASVIDSALQSLRRPLALERPPTPREGSTLQPVFELSGEIREGETSTSPSHRITIACLAQTGGAPVDPTQPVLLRADSSEPGKPVAWGSYWVVLPTESMQMLQDVDRLLSPRATPVAASDVASLRAAVDNEAWQATSKLPPFADANPDIARLEMRRASDNAEDRSAKTEDVAHALIALLTTEGGTPSRTLPDVALDAPTWRIEMRSAREKPLDVLAMRPTTSGGLAVRSGQVIWTYTKEQTGEIIRGLRELVPH